MEEQTIPLCKILANDIRFGCLRFLEEQPVNGPGIPSGVIGEHLGISTSGISQQLALLKLSGLVQEERKGNRVLYRIVRPLNPLVAGVLAYDAGRGEA